MATFEEKVETLTGIKIASTGSVPTQGELTQFLQDAVFEVVNRIITINPKEISKFTATTTSHSHIAKTGKILSIVREHNSTTILRSCTPIAANERGQALDKESLYYRTMYNPAYYELDGNIHIIPAASATGDNDLIVTQVTYDTGVAFGDVVPDNFPNEYNYLVVLYASCKSLQAQLHSIEGNLPSNIDTEVLAIPPVYTAPNDIILPPPPPGVDIDFNSVPSIGTFITPSFSATAPTYTPPIMSVPDWSDTNTWISTEEDSEMSSARVQEIQAKIGEYSAKIQGAQAKFTKEQSEYQNELQKYANEVQKESARVSSSLQDFQAQVGKAIQEYQSETGYDLSKYQSEIQSATSKFQSDLTNSKSTFDSEMAKVNSNNQNIMAKYNADQQNYISKINKISKEYELVINRFNLLKQQYDEAFSIMAPRQQQQQQQQARR